jgi:hypothetical protein
LAKNFVFSFAVKSFYREERQGKYAKNTERLRHWTSLIEVYLSINIRINEFLSLLKKEKF